MVGKKLNEKVKQLVLKLAEHYGYTTVSKTELEQLESDKITLLSIRHELNEVSHNSTKKVQIISRMLGVKKQPKSYYPEVSKHARRS